MKRRVTFLLAATIGAMAPAAIAVAQEAETAPPPRPSPPVFSLPENRAPAPQPDVQGPRAPGIAAPRLIRPDDERQQPPARQGDAAPPAQRSVLPESNPVPERQPAERNEPVTAERTPVPRETVTVEDGDAPLPENIDAPVTEAQPLPETGPGEVIPTPVEDPESGGLPWWLFAGLGLLGVAVLAFLFGRRRGDVVEDEEPAFEAEEAKRSAIPVAEPSAPANIPPRPAPVPAAPVQAAPAPETASDEPARVAIDFEPLVARFTPAGLIVSYRIHLENICDEEVSDVAICLGIRGADHGAMERPVEPGVPCVALDALPVNKRAIHEGEIQLAASLIRPLRVDDKAMLVPIIDLMPRYRDSDGRLHEHHATLLLGRESNPPAAKMAPFRLDGGFSQFGKLGCRLLRAGEPKRAAA
ncbi:hypothetical protein [Parasphingopyxis marina]|uniref:Uncharacterized protein n=1 Tax=Parasphingopyxis marina TaxID=2761622 RepID=A0A842I1H8_9SPHN|nr:hypothetical protein [Parasphingopyxis marina]MBC2778529.1 hypothetical protein [Parasphingopyxis marina]